SSDVCSSDLIPGGSMWVTGETTSTDFPTYKPLQASSGGGIDGFVAMLNAQGSAFLYSTYVGGAGDDEPAGLAVDHTGNAYVTGWTNSLNFPTVNAMFTSSSGGAFLFKLNAGGSAFGYSTYLNEVRGRAVTVDPLGTAYVTGEYG